MEGQGLVNLELSDLVLAYGLVLISIALARLMRIGQEWQMLWASVRMVVQLVLVGYLLHFIFSVKNPLPVMAVLLVMGAFSLQVIGGRIKRKMPHFYRVAGTSLFIGCGGATFLFSAVIVRSSPWYDPRYLIPLAGMIIGNSMNGATLAAERLAAEMRERREEIETALCLGASGKQASAPSVRTAFRAALLPTVNTMAAMGIVSLPGMMTGQILSGTEPIVAVRYQIAIMCAITGAVSVTAYLILLQGYRYFFSDAQQFLGE
ncbi:MAG TPA: iron export ABC transporter permease subunit FetB [Geomonas sp.]|nr:iron export ABC transporter permease subunit FetB [Geomonas sp.]